MNGVPKASIGTRAASALVWMLGHMVAALGNERSPLLLRDPSVSRTHIAFSYAGNIWVATREGRELHRLTSGGHEGKPVFSPDGALVAFAGQCSGSRAVYVVPVQGGVPRRLTFHPEDLGRAAVPDSLAWTPDGARIVFNSRRASFVRPSIRSSLSQLFSVPLAGGPVEPMQIVSGTQASFAADGEHFAYVPLVQGQAGWKRYRGGQTTPIWIARLSDSGVEARIPRENSNDFNPMWLGGRIYFLSDRNGPVSLFVYDVGSREVTQAVRNSSGFDIRSAAATSDAIVYDQFGSLHLFELATGRDRLIDVRPAADLLQAQAGLRRVAGSQIQFAELSPTGAQVLLGARGEVLTVEARTHAARNLTGTTDASERDPAWSPDGRSIAYFSDESGEYALHVREARGAGLRKFALGNPPAFYYSPTWSPDSTTIAYTDQRLGYWYIDLAKGTPVHVDDDLYTDPNNRRQLAWSADGRWLAYTRQMPNHLHAVFLYSVDHGRSYPVTDGSADALHIAFDRSGAFLYFTASTDAALAAAWLDMSSLQRPVTRSVYQVMLDKVLVDPEGVAAEIVPLPIPARNYFGLIPGKAGELFLIEGPPVTPIQRVNSTWLVGTTTQITKFNLAAGTLTPFAQDVFAPSHFLGYETSARVSHDGSTMLFASKGQWHVVPTSPPKGASPTADGTLDLSQLKVFVDPRREWRHMFDQVWRNQRDFFYDPALHGLDLEGIQRRYRPYLDNIATREDLNYLFDEMLANLQVGHLAAFGGDIPALPSEHTGLLGADYSVSNGRYRFERIFAADPWDPEVYAPLSRPDTRVLAGEYLLKVNGREVRPTADVYSYFGETADQSTELTVGPHPDGTDSRTVAVTPVRDEVSLRNYAWIEANRRTVDRLSGGRVAYVYLADMYEHGYSDFNRQYFAQAGKVAAVIDVRFNSGGLNGDHIIDHLRHPLMSYWHMRYGRDLSNPQAAIFGPKVLLINEMAGSGAETFAWMFRKGGLGPLIGKRTWGGLVGMYTHPRDLLDGGTTWNPNMAFYNPAGTWDVEGHGVDPDLDIELDPKAMRAGHDMQLEGAVTKVLGLLETAASVPPPRHPPYPNHYPKSGR